MEKVNHLNLSGVANKNASNNSSLNSQIISFQNGFPQDLHSLDLSSIPIEIITTEDNSANLEKLDSSTTDNLVGIECMSNNNSQEQSNNFLYMNKNDEIDVTFEDAMRALTQNGSDVQTGI